MRRKKERAVKERKPDYIGAKKFWAWQSREFSDAGFMFLMGYMMFYCTDILKLDSVLVGTLFAVSKVIDGITDVAAGYIVDRTNTRWGRGRPYDICLVGAWGSLILMFLCPADWSQTAKLIWIVLWYVLANAVFYTLLNAGEGVFALRAFTKPQIVKQSSLGAIATSFVGFSAGVAIPQAVKAAGTSQEGWLTMVIAFAIPMTLIGLCRMIFVKEDNPDVRQVEEKVKTDLRGIVRMFGKNKYLRLWVMVELILNIVSNLGVGVYFFDKVLGDIGLGSIFSIFAPLGVISLILLPKLLKRFHISKILIGGVIISMAMQTICLFNYKTLPILVVCYVISTIATLPATYASGILMYELADYNEYNGMNRMEASMSSLRGFMKRAGSALGTFLLGVCLKLIQYDPNAVTPSALTYNGLVFMMFGIPIISAAIQLILWLVYNRGYEKEAPAINAMIAEKGKAEKEEKDGERGDGEEV